MSKRRSRRIIGLLPGLGRAAAAGCRWLVRHPQPFLATALVAAGTWALWRYGQHAEPFRITQVQLPVRSALKPPGSLIGANLWEVDLSRVADELKRQEPWLKEVRVVRRLPNAIRIEPIARIPVAQVRLAQWYVMDRDGFILPHGSADPIERLIRVTGLDRATTPVRAGKENGDERVVVALHVLETLRRNVLLARRVTEVNVSDPQQIRFLMDDETEVRCGSETELSAHLERLRAALKAIAKQPVPVGYIDVRFQEPVIGPKI